LRLPTHGTEVTLVVAEDGIRAITRIQAASLFPAFGLPLDPSLSIGVVPSLLSRATRDDNEPPSTDPVRALL
jgi:hypothetical protein